MKEKTINCPFCETSMTAYEGVAIVCPHCKQNVLLEKKVTNNIEDQLYFLKINSKEKAEVIYKMGKEYYASKDFESAYRYGLAALDLNSESPSISFLVYASLSGIVTNEIENNIQVDEQKLRKVEKCYQDTKKLLSDESLKVELNTMHDNYLKIVASLNKKGKKEESKTSVESQQKVKSAPVKQKVAKPAKIEFKTRKACLDDPEPIDFPGISEFKPIKITFWALVCITALFLFYSYMAFFNPDLLGNKEAFESNPLSISIIIALLGFIGVVLLGTWIGYYLARKFYDSDSSEPFIMTLIRRVSLIGLLVCVVTMIWNGGLVLMINSLPDFLLEGITGMLDPSEEIQALTISSIVALGLIVFLNIFHIVNHTRLICEYNKATPRLIISEVAGRLEIISISILALTGVYYLVNWVWKSAIEFITFGSYDIVANVMWIVLIASASVFGVSVILDIATADSQDKKAS